MQGGVRPFRGSGAQARHYVESDRSTADDYYLAGDALASWTHSDAHGEVSATVLLGGDAYAGWVDWTHPLTGEQMGVPRLAGDGRKGSPRFQEMIVNAPKSLSVAAALHPDVSAVLDAAQADAADEVRRYLALHATTRVGPRGAQEVVPVEGLQTVGIVHHTSRAGDPHRHIHFQIGTRVWAAGGWRGLDGVALFKMQGTLRAIGTAVIAAHPQLAATLDAHGLTLDPETGEVIELEPFNALMSKRGAQVEANVARLVAEWEAGHPGETMSRTTSGRLQAKAWAEGRPSKRPTTLKDEAAWIIELRDAGYDETRLPRRAQRPSVFTLDRLDARWIANRALDRCAAEASAWTPHTLREQVATLVTETGVRATPDQLRAFIDATANLALTDCLSVLPPGAPTPEHVAHLTSLSVIAAETRLRDLLATLVPDGEHPLADVAALAAARGLDAGQTRAAAAVASSDPLVIVEGAAGSGKTSMLGVALATMQVARNPEAGDHPETRNSEGVARVLAPTRRAAQVAETELGVPATSVAALVHAHGWRWNSDGVWTRLAHGTTDPHTGRPFTGPPDWARLAPGERVIVDEAGMLDQDTTIALLSVVTESGATVALVGDRAQLPAVGRGGVLDMAAQIRGRTFDMSEVHRFTDPDYAALTIAMRDGSNPARVFDRLAALGLVRLHGTDDEMRDTIATTRRDGETVTVATNDEAAWFNEAIRARRVTDGSAEVGITVTGCDGLPIGKGDLIQTRKNDNALGVANRQTWTVQRVTDEAVWAREAVGNGRTGRMVRLPVEYVTQFAHLSYAATAYGVQGVTAPAGHTVLSEAMSGAGVYVGMTRGRESNLLHIVAADMADAKEQFIDAMTRDRADRGLAVARRRALEDVSGLVTTGPVAVVNQEKTRLARLIEHAEANAARWQANADTLTRLARQHRQARDAQHAIVETTGRRLEQVRAAVLPSLTAQATADAATLDATRDAMLAATSAAGSAGWLRRKTAQRDADTARTVYRDTVAKVRHRWGTIPATRADAQAWVASVAAHATEVTHDVIAARQAADKATTSLHALARQHDQEQQHARVMVYGPTAPFRAPTRTADQEAAEWRQRADSARAELGRLDTMPADQAAARVKANQAARATRQAQADALARRTAASPAQQANPGLVRLPGTRTPGLGL
ncbi:MAG: AAA family ATPase [Actinomycetia bacterium]|nr:AAA family ATPase [Actinomycetes bacterium]